MLKVKTRILVLVIIAGLFQFSVSAQCAMCRAVLESEEGQATAKGINNGIVYLMAIPYLLVGIVGFVIYKKFFSEKK